MIIMAAVPTTTPAVKSTVSVGGMASMFNLHDPNNSDFSLICEYVCGGGGKGTDDTIDYRGEGELTGNSRTGLDLVCINYLICYFGDI